MFPQGVGPVQVPLNPVTGQPWVPQYGQQVVPQFAPPQQQFAQPQPQQFAVPQFQQMPTRQTLSGEEVLDGANVPPELRGRKLNDVMRLYGALADDFMQRGRGAQRPAAPQQFAQPQPQPQQFQSPVPQQQFGVPAQPNRTPLMNDPNAEDRIAQVVRQVVGEIAQPMVQNAAAQGVQAALNQARAAVPDFQQLEVEIMEAVRGSPDSALSRADYWINAADLARGKRSRPGQVNPNAQQSSQISSAGQQQFVPSNFVPQSQQFVNPYAAYPQATPPPMYGQQVLPGQNPNVPQFAPQRPAANRFFTEAPTAPSPYQNSHAGSLTAYEQHVAQASGMSPEQYMAWRGLSNGAPR